MKVVLDTNVFISGIFWEGNYCSQIITLWKEGKIILVSSEECIEELIETLRDFKIQMPEEMIQAWQSLILRNSFIVSSTEKISLIVDDPEDNKFFEVAITGNAQYVISQDKHLLEVKEYMGIQVLKPLEFLTLIKA